MMCRGTSKIFMEFEMSRAVALGFWSAKVRILYELPGVSRPKGDARLFTSSTKKL